jgi:RimJ/RimL family protein N-acetyltransferase
MREIDVRQVGQDEWADLRTIRVAALTDSPSAFGSTLERELAFDEDRWRSWTERCGVFLGWADDRPVAIAGGLPEPDEVELIAVWAHPDTRGTGAGAAVIAAVIDWARQRRARRVTAWAVQDNDRAMRCYRKLGFTPTGRTDEHPHNEALRELEFALVLSY